MSFIYKSERAGRKGVPGVRRYYFQRRSQLRLNDLFRFGLVSRGRHGWHITPRKSARDNDRVVQTEGAGQSPESKSMARRAGFIPAAGDARGNELIGSLAINYRFAVWVC